VVDRSNVWLISYESGLLSGMNVVHCHICEGSVTPGGLSLTSLQYTIACSPWLWCRPYPDSMV
jgi:hypothetical protein